MSRQPPAELPHLETFCRAAECANFTAAGKMLGMTQAAVSQRIHQLEQALGVSLFKRKGRRVELSPEGRELYQFAQRILALHEEARQKITRRERTLTGDIRLVASTIPGEHILPAMLTLFRQRYPQLGVKLTVVDSASAVNQVTRGRAALGFVGEEIKQPRLEYRPFASDEMLVVVSAKHPWRRRKSVRFQELSREPLVLRESGSGGRTCFERALNAAGHALDELHVALELGSNSSIKEAVAAGQGVAILSALAVQRDLADQRMHAVRVHGMAMARTMYVVWDTRRAFSPAARALLAFLEPRIG